MEERSTTTEGGPPDGKECAQEKNIRADRVDPRSNPFVHVWVHIHGISPRDALHAAVVVTYDLEALCSYDPGFDQIAAVRRVSPEGLVR